MWEFSGAYNITNGCWSISVEYYWFSRTNMYIWPHQGSIVLRLAHTFIIAKSFRISREDSQIEVSPRHLPSRHEKNLT